MAKKGFDYFPTDVDIFQDRKIRRLLRFAGAEAFTVYVYLLTEIYRDHGYFLEWDIDSVFDASDALNLPENVIRDSVKKCLDLGLFHEELLSKMGVISSESIQKRYLKISIEAKRKNSEINKKLEIIDGNLPFFDETKKINPEEMGVSPEEMPINPEEMGVSPEEMPINPEEMPQRKEKKRKEKESKGKGVAHARGKPPPAEKIIKSNTGKKKKQNTTPPDCAPPPRKTREPPSREQTIEFFEHAKCPDFEVEARLFWNYYEGMEWTERNRAVDWRIKADSWVLRTLKFKNEKSNGTSRNICKTTDSEWNESEKRKSPEDHWGKL